VPVIDVGAVHHQDDFPLSSRAVQALWDMEDRHFWHAARNDWISTFLRLYGARPPATVLEVGCGSGAVVRKLAAEGYQVTGVDTDRRLIDKAHERCKAATLVVGDVAHLPSMLQGPYDVVGFFDVLEHLAAPGDFLRGSLQWARPGALVMATVPALRSLHSIVDDLSGHKRRYEPGELGRLFESVGLDEVAEHGIFRSSLPLIKRRRLAGKPPPALQQVTPDQVDEIMIENFRVPPAPLNAAMRLVCSLERRLALRASRGKVGASLVAVGRWGGSSSR
jgi:SAM-dependent methyltransferase